MKREEYEASLKAYRDNKNTMDYATELAAIEGRKEGHAEGKIEGKLEMIKNLLAMDMSMTQIVKASGLSKATIEKLLNDSVIKDD